MQILFLFSSTILLLFVPLDCKTFGRCELARELSKSGVSRALISNFVCLADAVSSLNTSKVSNSTLTNSQLGIFQIPTNVWCEKNAKAGGKCNMPCQKLLDANITDDIECVKLVQSEFGFKYWKRWTDRCKSNDYRDPFKFLPNLLNCGH